jgi:hypothetical protein
VKPVHFVCVCLMLAGSLALAQAPNRVPFINQPLFSNNAAPTGLAHPDPAKQSQIVENYGKLPLSFEANHGQTDAKVKFLSRGSGYTLFLTSDAAVFSLRQTNPKASVAPQRPRLGPQTKRTVAPPTKSTVLRMKLVKANPAAKVNGDDELHGTSNYFIGNDPKKWRTNVPTYARVKYEGIYPGVDLLYYGNQRQLEYDFVVSPGADPHRIQFDVRGARNITTDKDGDLVLHFRDGELRWRKPVVYQEANGTRQTIDGHYVVRHGHRVGFALGDYDLRRALIIDPAITYSTYLGGATNESGADAVVVDASGDAYLTGYTRAWDFPVTPGAFQTTCPSGQGQYGCGTWGAAFITKMNPTGTALVYSTYLGGNEGAQGSAIAIDGAGDAYVTGFTYASNFPTTPDAYQTTCNNCGYGPGLGDAFVTELNPTGSALVYSTYLGGDTPNQYYNDSLGDGIAIDTSGDVYVAGYTNFGGFPVTPGAFQTKCGSCTRQPTTDNAFVTKFNPTLSALLYSTFLGGSASDSAASMAVDAAGDVYLTGTATSTNFPVTQGAFQTTCSSLCFDAFVTELNPTGSALVYSTYLGGSISQGSGQGASGIVLDSSGDAYVTGNTGAADFPTTPGAFQTTCHACTNGGGNAFVTEFNPTGSALVYSTYLGGSTFDQATAIVLDTAGDAYLSGETSSTDFPTTPGAFDTCSGCKPTFYAGFFSEINPAGSALVYSTYLAGSAGFSSASRIAMDAAGGAYVVGGTSSTDFPITPGAFQTTCAGGCYYSNAFVTKFVPGDQVWPLALNFASEPIGVASSPQNTVLTNSGTTALDITGVSIVGANNTDFSQNNNCPASLGAGDNCTITVTFTPTAIGARNAAVSVADNAPNSPQTAALSGTGTQPVVTLSPTSLNFGPQLLGATSQPLPVMLSTNGTLIINSIVASSEFAQTNNCGTGLPAGGNCTINVTFTPNALGLQNGTLTISDDAQGTPQVVPLSGTGALPAVSLEPPNLNFGNQTVAITSSPSVVALTNTGSVGLTITSIGITGQNSNDFAQTNNCPTLVPPNGSCNISVTFTAATTGNRNAAVSITDNAPGSPQSVPLTGVGVLPAVTFSPTSLNFGNQTDLTTSAPQATILTNTGLGTLTITSIGIIGLNANEFAQTNNCPSSLTPNSTCNISVTFSPKVLGVAIAFISVADNAPGSPQSVPLAGIGVTGISVSPPSVDFPNQYVGTSGLPQTVTLTNTADTVITITNVTTSPVDFAPLSSCGNSVGPGAQCSIGVFFDPTTSGVRNGVLTITDSAINSPQIVPLTGMGQDFSVAPSSSSTTTVVPGQAAKYTVAVAPGGGFNQTVTLTCSGAPAQSSCSVSPSSVTLNGKTAAPVTVTVTTAGTSATLALPPAGNRPALWLAFSGLTGIVPGIVLLSSRPRKRQGRLLCGLAFLCMLCMVVTWSACGGGSMASSGSGGGTAPGTYNLTVVGTFSSGSANLVHSTKLTLVVQ